MKMVKSLLLGSAAGLVAVTAGQAADLPVKAKPVEYVKVCSLYGAGFYYMPGTDMCIKIGGWVRAEATYGQMNGNMTWGPYNDLQNNRSSSNFVTRERGYITADAREQTAYGTARAYIDVGVNTSDTSEASAVLNSNRAFIQWAGITAGLATSFFDFYSAPAPLYRAGYLPNEDTGDGGAWVWAYTAQLGNGVTASISAEQKRNSQIVGVNGTVTTGTGSIINGATLTALGIGGSNGYGGEQVPDIVANIRVDQTWGGAQIMGALHQVNATYYGPSTSVGTNGFSGMGTPGDAWGWVVGAGLRLNFPMIAQGDYFQGEINYTEGALRYLNEVEPNWDEVNGASQVWGVESDCVYSGGPVGATPAATNATSCNLTSAWSINASYEHYWTPSVHQSLAGAYEKVTYGSTANGALCWAEGGTSQAAIVGGSYQALAGCNNNWSVWGLGSRLQWDVTKSFYLGVELMYENFQGASSANGLVPSHVALGAPAQPILSAGNEGDWQATVRIHKDFLP